MAHHGKQSNTRGESLPKEYSKHTRDLIQITLLSEENLSIIAHIMRTVDKIEEIFSPPERRR